MEEILMGAVVVVLVLLACAMLVLVVYVITSAIRDRRNERRKQMVDMIESLKRSDLEKLDARLLALVAEAMLRRK